MTTEQDAQVLQLARILIKQFEGCKLEAYQDQRGVWTIGFGQTGPNIKQGLTWTQAQADQALEQTMSFLWKRLDHALGRDLLPQQAAAVLSLGYNIGIGALERSEMWKMLQDGQTGPAAERFTSFDKIRLPSGLLQTDVGLLNRRKAERALFVSSLA
jgi:lysozyme